MSEPIIDNPEDEQPDDSEDAELTAFLDGECDDATASQVEAKLARDPEARQRADDLKRSFDLLDYLPQREPSADFTTRTLTKVQPLHVSLPSPKLGPASATLTLDVMEPIRSPAGWRFWLSITFACLCVTLLGFGAHRLAARIRDDGNQDRGDLAADYRMLVHLPWYLGVDDLDFLKQLDDPELFAVSSSLNVLPASVVESTVTATDKQIELFQSYPTARKQQLRKLDQELHDMPASEIDRLKQTLESYALWLDRLNDTDRHDILSQVNGTQRLDAIRQLKQKQWRESLPEPVRKKIAGAASIDERLEFIRQYKLTQQSRHEEWDVARRQWDTLNETARKIPWPFSDAELASQLDDYIKNVFKVDPDGKFDLKTDLPAGARLTRPELVELREARRNATAEGKWFLYGLTLYRLSERHPYLPEPGMKMALVNASMFPSELTKELRYRQFFKQIEKPTQNKGKWPEYALEVAEYTRRLGNAAPPSHHLGPCKPGEFTAAVNLFLQQTLFPKLRDTDRETLAKLEGKWPEYPKQLLVFCKQPTVDLAFPNVMLPGKPSLWTTYYDFVPKLPRTAAAK